MYKIEVIKSIENIDEKEWDSICKYTISSWGWYAMAEKTKCIRINPRHMIIRKGEEIVAIFPMYIESKNSEFTLINNIIFRGSKLLNKFKLRQYPALICGWPPSLREKMMFNKKHEKDYQKITNMFFKEIDKIAEEEKIKFSALTYVSSFDKLKNNVPDNYKIFPYLNGLAYLDNKFETFYDYEMSMKSRDRKRVRREIKKNKESGVEIIRLNDISGYEKIFAELFLNMLEKYNDTESLKDEEYFKNLNKYLKGKFTAYIAKLDGEIIGFQITLGKEYKHGYMVGLNHEKTKDNFTYFNLCYYNPIEDMIKEKSKIMFKGFTHLYLKQKRGSKLDYPDLMIKTYDNKSKILFGILILVKKIKNKIQNITKRKER
ncbi:hypothetical protein HOD20_01715 [archaeon]|jgi:predicted N-acyltransferase|nr:hypothetical protein [Candidatus Woesearchaeota archaeon]MBT4351222.1 hypothetical protein [archaeon]MBT4647987.1 hypothetical protein [archaeon]MBT6822652.1 hypothetical protein [archaeon]MBT7391551.1 hypothetical protein [archaeon]